MTRQQRIGVLLAVAFFAAVGFFAGIASVRPVVNDLFEINTLYQQDVRTLMEENAALRIQLQRAREHGCTDRPSGDHLRVHRRMVREGT
jgi:hypothetical protein